MVFFAQKVLRKLAGNRTFVVVTDRVELNEQIAKTFKTVGAVSEAEGDQCHAASGAHLRELLRGNHRDVFTLVHKFQAPEQLTDHSDVIVPTDEAHRRQYDTLALNMRAALPKALFLAFTGTPLIRKLPQALLELDTPCLDDLCEHTGLVTHPRSQRCAAASLWIPAGREKALTRVGILEQCR